MELLRTLDWVSKVAPVLVDNAKITKVYYFTEKMYSLFSSWSENVCPIPQKKEEANLFHQMILKAPVSWLQFKKYFIFVILLSLSNLYQLRGWYCFDLVSRCVGEHGNMWHWRRDCRTITEAISISVHLPVERFRHWIQSQNVVYCWWDPNEFRVWRRVWSDQGGGDVTG